MFINSNFKFGGFMHNIIVREGNKKHFALEIINNFPPHTVYIEPFFGTGGIYFNKPIAKNNFINDTDLFIKECYEYFTNNTIKQIEDDLDNKIIHETILKESEDVLSKILLSKISYLGTGYTISLQARSKIKEILFKNILEFKTTFKKHTENAIFTNKDVFKFLDCCRFRGELERKRTLVYCDPPYSESKGTLKANKGWSIEKLDELILKLKKMGVLFAISEYNDSSVLKLFNKHNLKVDVVGSGVKMANIHRLLTKTEILAMNYQKQNDLFSF